MLVGVGENCCRIEWFENQFDVKSQAAGWSSGRGKACYCRVTIDDDLEDDARECLEQVRWNHASG